MNLVIVESPAKAKTIKKYLGGGFEVLASYGHVRDLVPKEGAVDPSQGFAMKYQVIERNDRHVQAIAKALKKSEALYLATDPDREGEAISWHLSELLKEKGKLKNKPVYRVVFNEITKKAVNDAITNPRELSHDLIDAQQARRALDYLWQGLGAYLKHHPHIRYMFGPVSLSTRYPRPVRDTMVHFYRLYFGCRHRLGEAKIPYKLQLQSQEESQSLFVGDNYDRDLKELKHRLSLYDLTIPTLYKQYTELCEPGGVCFLDFGVDPDFANCTDGMILVDVQKVKAAKRKRYLGESKPG